VRATGQGGRIEAALEDGVLTVRLANEDRANALDDGMLVALAERLRAPEAAGARAVLLAGAGERAFSAGLDLAGRDAAALREGERLLGEAARAVREVPGPVIGVLNGHAFGGGLELAMACDWRVARRGARFAMTPARLGVVYASEGLRAFVDAVGTAHARELFATARAVDAERALAIGLVNHVAEPEDLWALAEGLARDVAANAPIAVAGTTAILRRPEDGALAESWRERAYTSADLAEGIAAFQARRPPRFTGH
jgi:enoyl-CoA hydratase